MQARGKRVIDDALVALGGEKFLTVKDRVETGRAYSFYRDQLRGLANATRYTRYLDKAAETGCVVNDGLRLRIDIRVPFRLSLACARELANGDHQGLHPADFPKRSNQI